MKYNSLGRTGVQVSPLCLGTMNFTYRTQEDDAMAMLDRAIDAGINFIDTANFYGQPANGGKGQGLCETLLGKAFQGKRNQVVLATKFVAPMDWTNPNARGGSRRHLIQQCEASLKRLNTDHIDLYQMHHPCPDIPIDETLRALDDLVKSGKVRYIGTSSFAAWQLMEAVSVSEKYLLNRFISEQPRYNLLARHIESELLPMAEKYGIGIMAYAPLQGGLLSGKYHRDQPHPDDSRLADSIWGDWAIGYHHDRIYDVLEGLQKIATEKNCSLSQLAIAWVIHQPAVVTSIIGPRTMAQFEDNLDAIKVELTEEDLKQMDELTQPVS